MVDYGWFDFRFGFKIKYWFYVAVCRFDFNGYSCNVFSFITLPVEYDASNRALAWLKNKNMVSQQEYAGAEDSLKWAARTYVVAALRSFSVFVILGFPNFRFERVIFYKTIF